MRLQSGDLDIKLAKKVAIKASSDGEKVAPQQQLTRQIGVFGATSPPTGK